MTGTVTRASVIRDLQSSLPLCMSVIFPTHKPPKSKVQSVKEKEREREGERQRRHRQVKEEKVAYIQHTSNTHPAHIQHTLHYRHKAYIH